MPIFNTNHDISLYYKIIDHSQSQEVCILLGGLTRDHTIWRKIVPFLQNEYTIIVLDNRDAGRSTTPNQAYTIEEMAEDTAALIIGLELPPVHIIGHSMGGFIGIHLAAILFAHGFSEFMTPLFFVRWNA
jgi:3-oxoadipate enol-lactonase